MKETKNKNKRESVQEPLFATNYTTAAIQIGRQIKHKVNDYDTDKGWTRIKEQHYIHFFL